MTKDVLPAFSAAGWFHVGTRPCAAVLLDRDCQRSELLEIFGRVIIDGNVYEIEGVDSFAAEQQHKGWAVGLMIKGPRQPPPESPNPCHVECRHCAYRWVGLYLPLPIKTAAKQMGSLLCPKCGSGADEIALVDSLSPSVATPEG